MNKILKVGVSIATISLCAFTAMSNSGTASQELKEAVRTRMSQDVTAYGRDGIREIERLYRAYSRKAENADEAFKTLIDKFPKANRTGCAVMYAAQHSRGEIRVKWLNRAIEQHSDCIYGDGAQVGAYARWFLAREYLRKGDKPSAEKLFSEIRTKYPDAITHMGKRFSDIIPK